MNRRLTELGRMWNKTVMASSKILSWNFVGRTEENIIYLNQENCLLRET
jgi:hypothetical protein